MTKIDLAENPVLYNKLYQGGKKYPGNDRTNEEYIKKGELVAIVQLQSPNGGGDYLIPIDEFKKHNLDVASLCRTYQVEPYYNEDYNKDIATYKPVAGIYLANEDIKIAKGDTFANPQYGIGGGEQLVMPHGKNKIQEAYKDKDMKYDHPLTPIDLNNYEKNSKISDNAKKEISKIKELYKDSINDKEGGLNLKNTELNFDVYDIMQQKNILHENLYKQIGAINEYSKQLTNPKKDLEFMKELKEQINNLQENFVDDKLELQDRIDIVKSEPDLLKTMPDADKKQLLDSEAYCPEEIKDILNYSKEKMEFLEGNLTKEEKDKLGVLEKGSSVDKSLIDINKENRLKEIYEDTTREGAIEDLGYRQRVYTPYAECRPEALLCNLKAKDDLNKLMETTNIDKINKFGSKEIENLNEKIDKLNKEIKLNDKDYKTNVDDKVEYLKNKVDDSSRYTTNGQALNDKAREESINKIHNGTLYLKENPYCDFEALKNISDKIRSKEIGQDLKKELLCNLKAKDELTNIKENSNDFKVENFCEKNIKNFDDNIKRLEEQIKLSGDAYKGTINDDIKYMKDKLSDIKGYLEKEHPMKDIVKEREIQEIAKNTLNEMKPEFSEKLKDINQLYESTNKLSELRKEELQVSKINEDLRMLKMGKNALNVAKEKLEVVDKYKPIVDTYNSKKLFKNSYGNKHSSEIQEYDKAEKVLESMGVKNWDDYKGAEEKVSNKEKSLEGHEKIAGVDASKKRTEEIGKCKDKQSEIMKKHTPEPTKSKAKVIDRGMDI